MVDLALMFLIMRDLDISYAINTFDFNRRDPICSVFEKWSELDKGVSMSPYSHNDKWVSLLADTKL